MPAALARWKAAQLKIEPTENPNEVYVLAPDGIRVEVYGEPVSKATLRSRLNVVQRCQSGGRRRSRRSP